MSGWPGRGPVKEATIGLIGEAGAELVIPNWPYSDPKQANLMSFLEATIASRGNALAIGGSTTGVSGVMRADSLDRGEQLVDLMQQLVKSQQEFRAALSDWQRDFEVSFDVPGLRRQLDIVKQVQSGRGIR